MLKIGHYLSYNGHFYLRFQRKANGSFEPVDTFESFRKYPTMLTCYNYAWSNTVASLLSVDTF